ncbi:late competence development ComFB family protein [Kamptonema formosum]|uniref:late competence development ComFB family protein n=1 Tax=Kamptonema formosum TaxID=331992 RepID=UPI000346D81F|nr:late competence development ComFB family protein [Oscillatoria sp. PCC 10802]
MQPPPEALYCNALEPLVAEEVHRQLESLPSQLVPYIKPAEVIAYALNRLPPFYATSEEGWQQLQNRAKTQLMPKIIQAVRQGFAAVRRDPLKVSTPLKHK